MSLNFSNRPPAEAHGLAFTVRRTPTTKPLQAIITCEDLTGCSTHFYQGRTQPCSAPNCEACNEQLPWRWHGYVSALNPATHEHFIFEMTAQASDALVAYHARYETLRGCFFEARRTAARSNARVIIKCKPADLQQTRLPEPPSIERVLCHLWNLPKPEVNLTPKLHTEPAGDRQSDRTGFTVPDRILDGLHTGGNND